MTGIALLAGPAPRDGAEPLADQTARLGPLPPVASDFIAVLERSDLRGRGGAGFSAAAKWRAVAGRRAERPVLLVNGAEGEPFSYKDRRLMETRPHLVLDGAAVAARTVGAAEIVHYIGAEHVGANQAMRSALGERSRHEQGLTRIVNAPVRYISGEESAAVHFVNEGTALPTSIPPRPFERGVAGRPTLVHNVETLAHVALLARFGEAWFRSLGCGDSAGTVLVSVSGAVPETRVVEVPQGVTVTDAVNAAGGLTVDVGAVLLGGYFGSWAATPDAWSVVLDERALRAQQRSLGCGVIGLLPRDRCGVASTSRVMAYLAHESARQCGPCTFGLRAIAAATSRLAGMAAEGDDLEHVRRWTGLLSGRGACHHPDGAAGFLNSALRVFAEDFHSHQRERRCTVARAIAVPA